MRALVRIGFADDSESDACQSVLADLRAIEREIPKDLLDGETISKGIVVTAFDCSPRLMLTIGDVVNTGCCLNYQSGARINVLPAYVVDANIQALVSWQLKQSSFRERARLQGGAERLRRRPAGARRLRRRSPHVPLHPAGRRAQHDDRDAEARLCPSAPDRPAGERAPGRRAAARPSRRAGICAAASAAAPHARQSRGHPAHAVGRTAGGRQPADRIPAVPQSRRRLLRRARRRAAGRIRRLPTSEAP